MGTCVNLKDHHTIIALRRDVRINKTRKFHELCIVGVAKAIYLQRIHEESRMQVFIIQNDGIQVKMQGSEDFSVESLCRELAHLETRECHVIHQRCVVLLPFGAPKARGATIVFLEIERI